jgi:hypothetical protein
MHCFQEFDYCVRNAVRHAAPLLLPASLIAYAFRILKPLPWLLKPLKTPTPNQHKQHCFFTPIVEKYNYCSKFNKNYQKQNIYIVIKLYFGGVVAL